MRRGRTIAWAGDPLEVAVRTRTAPLLGPVLWASLVVLVATATLEWSYREGRHVAWWTYGVGAVVTLGAMAAQRAGHLRTAGIVLSAGFWGVAVAAVILLGGPSSPGMFILVPAVVTAALFWSWKVSEALAIASVAIVAASAWLTAWHRLPSPGPPSAAALAGVCTGSLAITTMLIGTAVRSIRYAVADSERRANELLARFRESPDAIVVLDDTGIVRQVNPAGLALAGLPEDAIVGRHFASLGALSNADAAVALRHFSRLLRGARRGFPLRIVRPEGTIAWVDARARVMADAVADGAGKQVQITLRDVTQRKLAEERRAELERTLLKVQRFETIGRVSGAVAHDVNNLLTVVSLVASSLRASGDPEVRVLADELTESTTRAAKLNRRLLVLGRQDALAPEVIDVDHVVEGMRRVVQRLAGDDLDLVIRLDPGPCVVWADAAQIEQVIINLVTNARDAMPSHGRITLETEGVTARVHGGPPAESVLVRVSDTGVGMDPATLDRIFEPFFTTKGRGGTGLGLAGVRDIVQAVGGQIEVHSRPGLGTRFEVALPRAKVPA